MLNVINSFNSNAPIIIFPYFKIVGRFLWSLKACILANCYGISLAMAGLCSGSFSLTNNVCNTKSYYFVKLTDSAYTAIDGYLKIRVSF